MILRKILFVVLFLGATFTASAKLPRIKVEWGAIAGLSAPYYSTPDIDVDVKNKVGWQIGLVSALNWGKFALEPQIIFSRQALTVQRHGYNPIRLRTNSIDVPILFSLRMLKPMRFYLGPVFTVMNDCKRKNGNDLLDFGRVRPTVSALVGVGAMVTPHLLLDFRCNWQLRGKHDVVLPDASTIRKLKLVNLSFSVGYIF